MECRVLDCVIELNGQISNEYPEPIGKIGISMCLASQPHMIQ